MDTHVIREHVGGRSLHLISGREGCDLLPEPLDDTAEFDSRTLPAERGHANQNHVILWLNHGPNLLAATGRRVAQKV